MRHFPTHFGWVFGSLWKHRSLIAQMTRREVVGRYRGSVMGLLWTLLYPLLMLAVYTFVFSVVFQARWGGSDSQSEFAAMVFTGMIVHGVFAEALNKAPQLVISNANFVKKVVFPLEVLSWVSMGSALFHAAISTAVLLAFRLLVDGNIPLTALLFPVVVLPLLLLAMGVSWFLASLGVYLRDVGQVTGVLTTILLFLSPVFYPVSALPQAYRDLIALNPLTPAITHARDTLLMGRVPDWTQWGFALAVGLVASWLGLAWFQRTRRGFADVI